jgi:hypothetical protein
VVSDLLAHGVPAERVVPVVNCAPRSPRSRAALAATLAELVAPAVARAGGFPGRGTAAPVFLPERKVEEALHDGARLPPTLGAPLAGALAAVLERTAPSAAAGPVRVRPGTLGRWAEPEAEAANG